MSVKAKLKVVLMADETIIAESEDVALWQSFLSKIYGRIESASLVQSSDEVEQTAKDESVASGAIGELAAKLQVRPEDVRGACRPAAAPPYIKLDHHHWEAFKKNTPVRGRGATGATAAAATLAALWCETAELQSPTLSEVAIVLGKLGAKDLAPRRTIRNCPWLQTDGDRIQLNPARVSKAQSFARAFCTKDWARYREELTGEKVIR